MKQSLYWGIEIPAPILLLCAPKMDDEVVQRVFQEGGRDYFQQQPSTSSSSSSILQSLPLHVVLFKARIFFWVYWALCFLLCSSKFSLSSVVSLIFSCCILGVLGIGISLRVVLCVSVLLVSGCFMALEIRIMELTRIFISGF